jgi:hypothetical protein
MGIDIGAPAGVAVHAFDDGRIVAAAINPPRATTGPTLVASTCSTAGRSGCCSATSPRRASSARRSAARSSRGRCSPWVGERHENGGWKPHVHVQLSWEKPRHTICPAPVTLADRDASRARFPDPRLILGPLY